MNLPPTTLYRLQPDGKGIGLGGPLPGNGAHLLEKDSWSAAVVDELEQAPRRHQGRQVPHQRLLDTQLDSILRNLDVKTLFFSGVNTDQLRASLAHRRAFSRYNCVLVEDCCGTTSPDFCREASIWNVKEMLRLRYQRGEGHERHREVTGPSVFVSLPRPASFGQIGMMQPHVGPLLTDPVGARGADPIESTA